MAENQTVESPNFEKISEEAGQFTSDAVALLWAAVNDTRATDRRTNRVAVETLSPKILVISPSASVDNLALNGASVLSFQGGTAQNFTGMLAPETDRTYVVFVHVSGAGTITAKQAVTSEAANQLTNIGGVDAPLVTGQGAVYIYSAAKWRQVA